MGRWLSADWSAIPEPVPYANPTNPQTLNLYAMVSDNPETFADLDGHDPIMQVAAPAPPAGPGSNMVTNDFDAALQALLASLPPLPVPQQATTPSQNPTDAQAQQQNATNNAERATEAGEAALNFTLAGVKIKAAAALATTAETGAGAVGAAYTAISATGNAVAGVFQSIGAVTGKTKATEAAAEYTSIATSASGLVTLVVTKGNVNRAATAAAVEGIVTSNPADLARGGTVARAAKAIDLVQNIHQIEQKIKNWF
jgi:hypothetical protein